MKTERLYMPMVCIKHRLKKDCNENRKIVHAHGVYKADINENRKIVHAHGVYKA